MGEAKRRGFWSPGAGAGLSPPRASCDIIYPGHEDKILRHGDKPKHCRAALGRALYDVCVGTCRCGACDKSIDSLDDFGCCIVSYVEASGRLLPNSPSWAICGTCTDVEFTKSTPHAVKIAEDLIHKALRRLGDKQSQHPAERRR